MAGWPAGLGERAGGDRGPGDGEKKRDTRNLSIRDLVQEDREMRANIKDEGQGDPKQPDAELEGEEGLKRSQVDARI